MLLPCDNFMLLSLINTALRDKYGSLEELCQEEDVDAEEISSRLKSVGYAYDKSANAFKAE